jgi:hypothetical protein
MLGIGGGVAGHQVLVPFMAAQVKIGGVLGHHALHIELRAQRGDGGLHPRDPAARQAIGAALVKGGMTSCSRIS